MLEIICRYNDVQINLLSKLNWLLLIFLFYSNREVSNRPLCKNNRHYHMSLLLGYLLTSDFSKNINENFVKFFLIIGLLGSFTTFSAFSYEVVNLIISKKILIASIYISISIFVCSLFAYLGMLINKF